MFDTFSQRFSREGDTRIGRTSSTRPRNLASGFEVSDTLVAEFRDHVAKLGLVIDETAWQQDLPFIKAMIRYEIDLDLFGLATASEHLARVDPQLQFALSTFTEAEGLLRLRGSSPTTRRAAR